MANININQSKVKIGIDQDILLKVLEAMYFNFSPYLDNDDEIPEWIKDLIQAHNELIEELPDDVRYEHKLTSYFV